VRNPYFLSSPATYQSGGDFPFGGLLPQGDGRFFCFPTTVGRDPRSPALWDFLLLPCTRKRRVTFHFFSSSRRGELAAPPPSSPAAPIHFPISLFFGQTQPPLPPHCSHIFFFPFPGFDFVSSKPPLTASHHTKHRSPHKPRPSSPSPLSQQTFPFSRTAAADNKGQLPLFQNQIGAAPFLSSDLQQQPQQLPATEQLHLPRPENGQSRSPFPQTHNQQQRRKTINAGPQRWQQQQHRPQARSSPPSPSGGACSFGFLNSLLLNQQPARRL